MERNNFWNDAAKCGAIVGALLAVSYLLETWMSLSGRASLYYLMSVEWIAAVVLHYYLLHRFTRRRSGLYSAEEGFTFGQGYGYILAISGFGGFIVGIVQALFLHLIMGYSTYIERVVGAVSDMIARSGGIPASMEGLLAQTLEQVQSEAAPSVLRTVWGGTFSGLLFGAVFGLIIAGVIARAAKPFDAGTDE